MTAATHHVGPPDWSNIAEDVLCPLCEYNLRGVQEPRCPECGYRFEWPEVLDPHRRPHRYLFEHHPERNVWSFLKTLTGQVRPGQFWRQLHPVQPLHPGRLRRYWLVAALVYFVCIQAIAGLSLVRVARDLRANNRWHRAMTLSGVNPAAPPAWVIVNYKSYQGLITYLDMQYPTQIAWPLMRDAFGQWFHRYANIELLLVALLWPWLTFAALLVFRISMRRAKIRPAHVLRCVVYSSDALLWIGLVSAAVFVLAALTPTAGPLVSMLALGTTAVAIAALCLHMLWRLVQAYRLYLRFDRPVLTVLASQAIAGLAILKIIAMFTIDRS